MTETYRLTAAPSLYPEGEYQGKLKSVTFTATSQNDTRQWFAKNCGQFETAFSKIMLAERARSIVASLMHGDQVDFPGHYREHQFAQGFLFERTPVYLVLPPIFLARRESA
jgi:hypothetical protein